MLLDRVQVNTPTIGTGTAVLGTPTDGYQNWSSAGAIDGNLYSYLILDVNGAWEVGQGIYTAAGPTMTRPGPVSDPSFESSTGTLLVLSGAAMISCSANATDFASSGSAIGQISTQNLLSLEEGIAAPNSMYYGATPGRWTLSPTGFVKCAANQQRLWYDANGLLLGSVLQPGDTYFSAPWDNVSAPHTSADPAYLSKSVSADTVAYAGQQTDPSIFLNAGQGVVVTQNSATNGIFTATNCKTAAASLNDVIRTHAIISISPGVVGANTIQLRNSAFVAATFSYDASGAITGFTENWANYRIDYFDMGTINGKRWYYLWFDMVATAGTQYAPSIGFSGTADIGRSMHICELMIQRNPVAAPAAIPVCADSKTFADDTIFTGIQQQVGYAIQGIWAARSQTPGGKITAPAINIGLPYWPIAQKIDVYFSTESADRSGILSNQNELFYMYPWKNPSDFTVTFGPGTFPRFAPNTGNRACGNLSIVSVFQNRPELIARIQRIFTSKSFVTGSFTADSVILSALTDKTPSLWSQSEIPSGSINASFAIDVIGDIHLTNSMVMGAHLLMSRSRYQYQSDWNKYYGVYCGTCWVRTDGDVGNIGATISAQGTYFNRMARGLSPSGNVAGTTPTTGTIIYMNLDSTAYDLIWSDGLSPSKGRYQNGHGNSRLHGRLTSYADLTLWQSTKEIEINRLDGSGWVPFSSSGLTIADLPLGKPGTNVGVYNYTTNTLDTSLTDSTKSIMIRYFYGWSGIYDKPGYQWHSGLIPVEGKGDIWPVDGDTFVIEGNGMLVRVYYQYGHWTSGGYVASSSPASVGTGTHPDNFQPGNTTTGIYGWRESGCIYANKGQGPFLQGTNPSITLSSDYSDWKTENSLLIIGTTNAFRIENPKSAGSTYTLKNTLIVQMNDPYRYTNGTLINVIAAAVGANAVLAFDNAWIATNDPTGLYLASGATSTGTLNHLSCPNANNNVITPVPDPSLRTLMFPNELDSFTQQVSQNLDPWNFSVSGYACQQVGVDLNSAITTAIGTHPRWFPLIEGELEPVYFRAPNFTSSVSASTAIGTIVASGIKATSFDPYNGGNGNGNFALDGLGNLVVAKSLVGLDDVYVLRTALDETILLDIS